MSLWKIVLLFIILGGEAMGEQLWSLQPLKRTELPTAGDAQSWDGHTDIAANHRQFALKTDQGIAALLADLKQRGLLDSTLMVCCGELGRTSASREAGVVTIIRTPSSLGSSGVECEVVFIMAKQILLVIGRWRILVIFTTFMPRFCTSVESIMSDWPIDSMAVTFALPMSMGTW
jgi:hypothetical protein